MRFTQHIWDCQRAHIPRRPNIYISHGQQEIYILFNIILIIKSSPHHHSHQDGAEVESNLLSLTQSRDQTQGELFLSKWSTASSSSASAASSTSSSATLWASSSSSAVWPTPVNPYKSKRSLTWILSHLVFQLEFWIKIIIIILIPAGDCCWSLAGDIVITFLGSVILPTRLPLLLSSPPSLVISCCYWPQSCILI